MTNHDTTELLKETNLGMQMAIYSFDQLLERIKNPAMKKLVTESRNEHKYLENEINTLMKSYDVNPEGPKTITKGMAWMETNMKMSMEDSDRVAADILTQGCNMGTKKLNKYINQYAEAEPAACDAAKRLVMIEDDLERNLRLYL